MPNFLVSAKTGGGGKEKPVDNKMRQDWNDYTDWLATKGLRGHPSLDTGDLGNKMIDQYRKENPATSISRDAVKPIQKEFSKYRDWSINELRNKRAQLVDAKSPNGRFVEPNENLDNYMKELSNPDSWPGSLTTRHKFPAEYLKSFENKKLMSTQNKGLINTSNPVLPK